MVIELAKDFSKLQSAENKALITFVPGAGMLYCVPEYTPMYLYAFSAEEVISPSQDIFQIYKKHSTGFLTGRFISTLAARMESSEEILKEIKELRSLITKLTGIPDQQGKEPFSNEAVEKAAKEFQKLSIQRGEWIESGGVDKYIKDAPYYVGSFLRDEFGFTNCFKRGRTYYYNKNDLIALGSELKKRNVNLGRYMELKADQAKFEKYLASIFENSVEKGGKGGKPSKKKRFKVPESLRDINSTPPKLPPLEVLKAELEKLKAEFLQLKLSEYVDIYKGHYAMAKPIWKIDRFLEPALRRRIRTWPSDFNLVNGLIEETTKKKENFIPIPESELIRL